MAGLAWFGRNYRIGTWVTSEQEPQSGQSCSRNSFRTDISSTDVLILPFQALLGSIAAGTSASPVECMNRKSGQKLCFGNAGEYGVSMRGPGSLMSATVQVGWPTLNGAPN